MTLQTMMLITKCKFRPGSEMPTPVFQHHTSDGSRPGTFANISYCNSGDMLRLPFQSDRTVSGLGISENAH
jgi:hypothetical protein